MATDRKRGFDWNKSMPHAFAIIIVIVLLSAVLTWIVPAGQFDRVENEELGRELVVPGSYHAVDRSPVGPWGCVKSLYDGMVESADIIFFILIAYGYVFMLLKTGAIDSLVGAMLRRLGRNERLLIPAFMLLFGVAGSTFGMYEETYGLIPAFIAIAITLGYDGLVGGAIVFVGVATGFAAATLNPFTVGIAQGIAQVTPSGKFMAFRVAAWAAFMALSVGYTMWYAAKVKKDPEASYVKGVNFRGVEGKSREEVMALSFTGAHKLSLLGFVLVIAAVVVGVTGFGFYLSELSAIFIVAIAYTGIVNRMKFGRICDLFIEGASNAVFGALMVGLARAIQVVLTDANIIDTIVNSLANAIQGFHQFFAAAAMLVVQNIVNFFIPSGSGQAVVMMPIMAPLSDLLGLSREVAITAYQFGDGFSNMFWPTAVATECAIMGISMDRWYKFITPLFLMMFALQAVFITIGVFIGI
ncbi:MAG TPA: Na+/H+ antiporter NhaC family protein [Spirochaetales bacterium]|nr:Na+/H+ antiporter NhaC family protein [Spirochaetales bacterium]HRY55759.1 Na+/H+ antiporter NhaC family protein [Spirochaetia bacterium]HRZ64391.1 Na+/H+ antiporter NhaC family protein [Spirochaetia bacterium]